MTKRNCIKKQFTEEKSVMTFLNSFAFSLCFLKTFLPAYHVVIHDSKVNVIDRLRLTKILMGSISNCYLLQDLSQTKFRESIFDCHVCEIVCCVKKKNYWRQILKEE